MAVQPAPSWARLQKVYTEYESGVREQISAARVNAIVDGMTTIGVPGAATLVSYFLKSTDAVVASLGLGSVNAGVGISKGQSIMLNYSSKRRALDASLIGYKVTIAGCDPTNDTQIQQIIQDITKDAKALASTGPSS